MSENTKTTMVMVALWAALTAIFSSPGWIYVALGDVAIAMFVFGMVAFFMVVVPIVAISLDLIDERRVQKGLSPLPGSTRRAPGESIREYSIRMDRWGR